MKLYIWGKAPNCRRIYIFLAEKGIDIPMEEVGDGAELKQSYKDKFPQAMVPMLELDDGTIIGEAMAIARYFEATNPEPALFGSDPISKAHITAWEHRAYEEGLHAIAEIFRNSNPAFEGRGLAGFSEPIPQIPELIERGKTRLSCFYKKIDQQLAKNEYLAGNSFSVADITALSAIDFASAVKLGMESELVENCANVQRWHKQVSSRPSATAGP